MSILVRFRVFAVALVVLAGACVPTITEITKQWDPIPETRQVDLSHAYSTCQSRIIGKCGLMTCDLLMQSCMASAGWKPSCLRGWGGIQMDDCGGEGAVPSQAAGTALHVAAFNNNEKTMAVLVGEGVPIDGKNQHGWTPLQSAIFNDSDKAAELLIKRGANIRAVDENGGTLLHMAAKHNSQKVAGLLISSGANLDSEEHADGFTPLHRAAYHGNVKVADLLIARGANLKAETYSGETPLDIAKQESKPDVVDLLERANRAAARKAESGGGELNSAGNDAETVFENAWRSVVVVFAGNSQGGGVVINEPNQVATNCHVVDESPDAIRVYKGENRRAVRDVSYPAKIVSEDKGRDVCVLSVPGLWAIPAKIRPVAELEIGEAVYAVGTPKGFDFSISNGIVSQLREEEGENAPLIQTNAAISPGSSGGGLFDSEGRLIGLTTSKFIEGENLNFAVPVDWALELSR